LNQRGNDISEIQLFQSAVIPWRKIKEYGEVLLISTRKLTGGQGRQWIIPQGMVEPWQTPIQAGINEAWEEAGVKGKIEENPIALFTYKNLNEHCKVFYYPLEVTEKANIWPEKNERSRMWFSILEAEKKVKNEKLKEVFKKFKKFLEKNEREL